MKSYMQQGRKTVYLKCAQRVDLKGFHHIKEKKEKRKW